jgi:hypothetical protein
MDDNILRSPAIDARIVLFQTRQVWLKPDATLHAECLADDNGLAINDLSRHRPTDLRLISEDGFATFGVSSTLVFFGSPL